MYLKSQAILLHVTKSISMMHCAKELVKTVARGHDTAECHELFYRRVDMCFDKGFDPGTTEDYGRSTAPCQYRALGSNVEYSSH